MSSIKSSEISKASARLYNGFESIGLSKHLPLVKRIVEHFDVKGMKLVARGPSETPSLSIRVASLKPVTLLRIATNGGGFIELDFKALSIHSTFKSDNQRLVDLRNTITKIDPTFLSKDSAKKEPWFALGCFQNEGEVKAFLSATRAVLHQIKTDTIQTRFTNPSKAENIARAWDLLTERASYDTLEAAQITYEDFRNEVLGREAEERVKGTGASYYLYPIQELCQDNKLPPLTGLVIGVNSRLPSSGYAGIDGLPYQVEMRSVLNYDWAEEVNPWRLPSGKIFNQKDAVNDLLRPEYKRQQWTQVPIRQYQSAFRKALLKAYDGKCAICAIANEALLDAAHIKPYAESAPNEEAHVSNGILLCKNHHASFDARLWWLDESYAVRTKVKFAETQLGQRTIHFSAPKEVHHRPLPEFIQYHNKSHKL